MTISFDNIPSDLLIPFTAVEFNASKAQQGPSVLPYAGALIGQKTSAGTGTAGTWYKVTNSERVAVLAGRGSILHRQAIGWYASNKSTELWIGILDDAGGGVAATGTLTFTGPATAAGSVVLYLGGVRLAVAIASGATASAIATAVVAAITAATDLPVTAAVGGVGSEHIVTVTFKNAGTIGNSYDMRHSYRFGEALPTGVGLAIVAMASGATNPSLTALIAAAGDQWFHIVAHPYTDSTNLGAIETELASRNGPMRMIDGVAFTSASGSHATLTTLGDGRNSPHSVIVAQAGESPLTPPFEFAAEVAAIVALYGQIDPARPFQTLAMSNAIPMAITDQFTKEERNLLLKDGIATVGVGAGEVVQLERMVTTYQKNAANAPDSAYRDVTTLLTLMYLRYSFRVRMQLAYPRHKLASDGTAFGAGQAVITPKDGKGEAVGWFKQMEKLGLVEGLDQFKRDLVVERDTDPNRLNFLLPPDLINQLIVTAAQVAFRL